MPVQRRVRMIKTALLLAAAGLLVVLFLWPTTYEQLNLEPIELEEELANPTVGDLGTTTMVAPRFTGEDVKNRRWEVRADQARQAGSEDVQDVWLTAIEASATTSSGKPLTFRAGAGRYEGTAEALTLSGGVEVEGYGFTLSTPEMTSDLADKSARGDDAVEIEGAGGSLFAQGFEILHNGEKVRLTGGVKGRFFPGGASETVAVSPTRVVSPTTAASPTVDASATAVSPTGPVSPTIDNNTNSATP